MRYTNSLSFARQLDRTDPVRSLRKSFYIPPVSGKPNLYFTGNSLGLQPVKTKQYIAEELKDWATLGVEGHEHGKRPWLYYHKFSQKTLASIVGAQREEVIAMNQLTVNLHLMMTSFYRPDKTRFKILTEAGAFSSDQYAFESQLRLHGYSTDEALIELKPREGEFTLRTEDIEQAILANKNNLALVIFGAVQYYTGQFFNIPAISKAAKEVGAVVGFDLAHAIGNVPLALHNDNVDFAVWCSYKYLNSGPGGIAGAFIHQKHAAEALPRLAGWWGHREDERFQMKKGFQPIRGAAGWQVSNVPILSAAAHLASLEIFSKTTMKVLRKKSVALTGFLEFLLDDIQSNAFQIITPKNPLERGCQLSILMNKNGKKLFDTLTKKGAVVDWREPNVIRISPVPLYNTFEEVYRLSQIFKSAL